MCGVCVHAGVDVGVVWGAQYEYMHICSVCCMVSVYAFVNGQV